MNKKRILWGFVFFLLGSIFNQILIHLRFNSDLLRREMIIFMSETNSGYFLGFIILDIFILMIILSWIFILNKKDKQKEDKNDKKYN